MGRWWYVSLLCGGIAVAMPPDDVPWQPLFDGRSLAGWSIKCVRADEGKPYIKLVDGTVEINSLTDGGHNYVWLQSDGEYGDFVFRCAFQAFRESPGNTGVQVRSRYDDEARWMDGPQIDVNPPGPWRTGMVWDETRGNQRWLWPEIPKGTWVDESQALPGVPFYYSDQPPGWNQLEITAIGTRLSARLNGALIMAWNGAGVLDDATHQARRVGQRGHIALQLHTGDKLRVRYRDMAVRDLDHPVAARDRRPLDPTLR
ncbi:MAG: DUF1080 domain-containing protein [Armatimonadetes bacterium]|nr:DUF1080 domain-containing protein [Armatimonadota bacterium]